MFRHKGKRRTHSHNLRLASTLSFTAGIVNISGVLSMGILTTNVTGHFAYFAEELIVKNYAQVFFFFLFIASFLIGAISSSILVELVSRKRPASAHALPMILEAAILISVGLYQAAPGEQMPVAFLACALLFAMGLQNSLVTQISDSKVRTTHLTGLFTDLGIEISQLFFYRKPAENQRLWRSIRLRAMIIGFFFLGCVSGGFLFGLFGLRSLLFAAASLFIAMYYDMIRYKLLHLRRKTGLSQGSGISQH
jgi:uncharacterized membrane protein YoaK (UPF0700 family)